MTNLATKLGWAPEAVAEILADVATERAEQEAKYPGSTCASLDLTHDERMTILIAEVGEVSEEVKLLRWRHTREPREGIDLGDARYRDRLRHELLQVAAITVAWVEAIDEELAT